MLKIFIEPMKLKVVRYSDDGDSTAGLLFINGKFECYTLEDEHREVKVMGETCIPEGTYKLGLRTVGGFNKRYTSKFPDIHKGMLQVMDVPGFEYILIHLGNTDEHTAGCLLVGSSANNNQYEDGFISASKTAYKRFYSRVAAALEAGTLVEIEYVML